MERDKKKDRKATRDRVHKRAAVTSGFSSAADDGLPDPESSFSFIAVKAEPHQPGDEASSQAKENSQHDPKVLTKEKAGNNGKKGEKG